MNANAGIVSVFYKGSFEEGPPFRYANGVVKSKGCDGDYLNFEAIRGYIGDLGYPPEVVRGIHFKGHYEDFSKLRLFWSESCVREIAKIMRIDGEVEFYVDHGEHLQKEVVPTEEDFGDNNNAVEDLVGNVGPHNDDQIGEAQENGDVAGSLVVGGPGNHNGPELVIVEESFSIGPNMAEISEEEDPDFVIGQQNEEDDYESEDESLVASDPETNLIFQQDREEYLRGSGGRRRIRSGSDVSLPESETESDVDDDSASDEETAGKKRKRKAQAPIAEVGPFIEDVRLRYKCRKTCEWVLLASKDSRDLTYRIKTYNRKHTCRKERRPKLATQNWLANYFRVRIRKKPFYTVGKMRKDCKRELNNLDVITKKAYRGWIPGAYRFERS